MEILILNIALQYILVGFICAILVDVVIRTTKSTEPFTLLEIFGAVVAWPVILGTIVTAYINDRSNQ